MTHAATPEAFRVEVPRKSESRILAALAAVEIALGLVLARSGVRFDGFLDVHRPNADAVPFGMALLDQAAGLLVGVVVAVALVRVWRPHVRWSAVALVIALARLPLVICAPAVLAMPPADTIARMASAPLSDPAPLIVLLGLVGAGGVFGCIAVLAIGLRRITGARGWTLAALTFAILAIAEIVGKLVLASAIRIS